MKDQTYKFQFLEGTIKSSTFAIDKNNADHISIPRRYD